MNQLERRDLGLPYLSDEAVFQEQKKARTLLQTFNTADRSDFPLLESLIQDILGKTGNKAMINPPFYCDYGTHIEVGDNFFANYNCTILDVALVKIGRNVMFAPNVSIYTAGHPVHPQSRNSGYEYGFPVTIGDNVWIGGNVVITPGVTIGNNVVIGAGSVVTRDIPDSVIAVGNPCRVIRQITQDDLKYYYKDLEFDDESMEAIHQTPPVPL